jgi:hypothetical protein
MKKKKCNIRHVIIALLFYLHIYLAQVRNPRLIMID